MADDAIYRETKQSIDRLFAQVSGGAGSASKGLYNVGSASRSASSGLSSLTSGSENAARAAGSFVSSVRTVESAASHYNTSLAQSVAKLKEELNVTVHGVTSGIDESMAKGAAGLGMVVLAGKKIVSGAGKMTASMLNLATTSGRAGVSIKGLMSSVKGATGAVGGFIARHATLAAAIGLAATVEDYVDDSYKTWKLLSTAGITLSNNLNQVGGMAGRTRLDFDELGGALSKSSGALARMGGTADHGAKSLVSMQEAMMDTTRGFKNSSESYSMSMKMMGVGPQESMDLLGTLLEDQTFAAKIRGMTEGADAARRSEITADYIGQLDQLSKLTGKSRQTLAKEMAQKAQDAQFASTLMDMDKDQAAAAKKQLLFIENTYGKDASDLFKARLAGVVPTSDGARKLMATSLGGTLSDMAQQTSQTSGIAAGEILKNFHAELGASAKETREVLAPLARAGGLVGSSFSSLFTATHEATLKNQALIEQLDDNTAGMDRLADAIDKAYNTARGVITTGPDGQVQEREKFTDLLKTRVSLETIADLAGTAVQAWMSGIGYGGADYKRTGAGSAMLGYQIGADMLGALAEAVVGFNTEGAADFGGDMGLGHGLNQNSWHKYIGKLFGDDTNFSTLSSTGVSSQLSKNNLGDDILASARTQTLVEASLANLGVSRDTITQGIQSTKMLAAQQWTGKTESELQALMAGTGPRDTRTLREVVRGLQAAGPPKTDEEIKNDLANEKGQKLAASYVHEPITKKLDRIADILLDGSIAVPGSEVASTEKKKDKPGADPYQAGRNAMAESMQISQV